MIILNENNGVMRYINKLINNKNDRWRKLEGSDPKKYELIQKIQMLQKRLISKTQEVVEKDMFLKEKERLYVELKNILARQPGPEVAEQLGIYQQTLKGGSKLVNIYIPIIIYFYVILFYFILFLFFC